MGILESQIWCIWMEFVDLKAWIFLSHQELCNKKHVHARFSGLLAVSDGRLKPNRPAQVLLDQLQQCATR